MFIYLAIKNYKELCRVEDRARSGRLKSVRAEDYGRFLGGEFPWPFGLWL